MDLIVYTIHWNELKCQLLGPKGFDVEAEWRKLDAYVQDKNTTKLKRFTDHLRYKCGFKYIESVTINLEK